ncbi:hypothetical protein AAFF_G00384660 [Aldrovandia affinis]|uniref:Uncharacterized protein n=1 Tax=Aldrovandia affinis TaxID=143900 RepID=A0AAD7VZD0_9TELE|nr:hypothetical protein AAFF_G00384660 [Aldrovandia affinis]
MEPNTWVFRFLNNQCYFRMTCQMGTNLTSFQRAPHRRDENITVSMLNMDCLRESKRQIHDFSPVSLSGLV